MRQRLKRTDGHEREWLVSGKTASAFADVLDVHSRRIVDADPRGPHVLVRQARALPIVVFQRGRSERTVRFKRVTDDCERLAQVAFPEEVLIGRTLDEQAESLANWILRGFEALELLHQVARPDD